MSALPSSLLRNLQVALNSNTKGQILFDALNEALGAGGSQTDLIFDAATELTIAGGAVTATQGFHTLDTQGDSASDDLDTIEGLASGEIAVFKPASDARTVVIKHGTGNILCPHAKDISLAEDDDHIMVVGTGTKAIVIGYKVDSALGGAAALIGSLASLSTTEQGSIVGSINEVVGELGAYLDQMVTSTIAVENVAASNATTMTLQLKRAIDHSTNVASARQVMIQAGSAQYQPEQPAQASVTFSAATAGSIIASGQGWALVETSATGAFACTVTNTDDETLYFWAVTAAKVSDLGKRCTVVASNSDEAIWSA